MTTDSDSNTPYDDLLGAYIRNQRQLAALSQRQLATMTNVSNAYLSQIERGMHQPSVKVLRSIADALNLSGEALFARAGMASPDQEQTPAQDSEQTRDSPATESAILADAQLTEDEKQILLSLYRKFSSRTQGDS